MTTLALYRHVAREFVDDELAFAAIVSELSEQLRAQVLERGDAVFDISSKLIEPTLPWSMIKVDEPSSRWWRLVPSRWRPAPRHRLVPAPPLLLVEAQILEVVAHCMPLVWHDVAEYGPESMRVACHSHTGCAGGVFDGVVDAGGYRTVSCPEHGELWTRKT